MLSELIIEEKDISVEATISISEERNIKYRNLITTNIKILLAS
jgi:hypothetical protein